MAEKLDQEKNLILFDEIRVLGIKGTDAAIAIVETLEQDEDFRIIAERNLHKLRYSRTILQDNTLPMALMASFQTGKSTTTSAMADGHEITPCGKGGGGIRTSSIPVTIYNNGITPDIVVNLYPNRVLVQHILSCCADLLEKRDPADYDLNRLEDRQTLMGAVTQEVEIYKSTKDYDPERMGALRVAILILSYFNSPGHQRLMNNEFTTIRDIQPFLAFPDDLETRWALLRERGMDIVNAKDSKGRLLFDEISSLYVFIDNIVIPVHSEFMGETGSAIIDPPGTMASNEDTERALNAAQSAAVVLFLLSGNQQLSTSDLQMLRTLKTAGLSDKVVFAVNFSVNPDIIRDNIEPTLLAQIMDAGYTAPHHQRFLYYNAFLAQRAAQGQLLLTEKMDSLTEKSIRMDACKRHICNGSSAEMCTLPVRVDKVRIDKDHYEEKTCDHKCISLETAWQKTTIKVLRAIDEEEVADELINQGLCEATVRLIDQASHWREMITKLREHVMNNRAAGVLRDLGVSPVASALMDIENALETREKSLNETVDELERQYKEAETLFHQFSEEVEGIISVHLNESSDEALANDYYKKVVLAAIDDAAANAAPKVFGETTSFTGNVQGVWNKAKRKVQKGINAVSDWVADTDLVTVSRQDDVETRCSAIVNSCFRRAAVEKGTAWSADLEHSSVYTNQIKNKVRYIQNSLRSVWKNLDLDQNALLAEISPAGENVKLSGWIGEDTSKLLGNFQNIKEIGTGREGLDFGALLQAMGVGVGAFVGGAYIYLFVLPLDFIIPGFGDLMLLASVGIAALIYRFSSSQREKRIEVIRQKIKENLRNALSEKMDEIERNIIEGDNNTCPPSPGVSVFRKFYVKAFNTILSEQEKELKDAYEERRKALEKTEEERKMLAEKAKNWREKKIRPIREKLDEILAKINQIWG